MHPNLFKKSLILIIFRETSDALFGWDAKKNQEATIFQTRHLSFHVLDMQMVVGSKRRSEAAPVSFQKSKNYIVLLLWVLTLTA